LGRSISQRTRSSIGRRDARHVFEHHGRPGSGEHERDGSEVVEGLQVPARPNHVLGFAQLQHRAARLAIRVLDRLHDARVRNSVGTQPLGIEHDLVLAHHAAEGSDFGDIGHGFELVAQQPVLQRSQLTEIMLAGPVDERVLVNPADAGGVGAQRGLRAGRQPALHLVQILEDS
jgi:hypothetical protein